MTKKIISFVIGIVMIIFCIPLNIFLNIQNIQILPKAISLTDEELEEYTIQRLYGDLNGDNQVNLIDLSRMKKRILYFNNIQSPITDLNGDGYTNVIDFLLLKSYLLGTIDVLPIGESYSECLINNQGSVTREMWLHELITLFSAYDNYNETLNCPYTDINTSNYYNDIVLCYNYGALDEVTEFNPTENASREFIAHTTNYFVGFLNEENVKYTFNECNDVKYPEDIQALINRGWLSCLENDYFFPNEDISDKDITDIVKNIKTIIESTKIDPNHEDECKSNDDILKLYNEFSVNGNVVTIYDANELVLNVGDTFILNSIDGQKVYKVTSSELSGNNLIVTTEQPGLEEIFQKIDIQKEFSNDDIDWSKIELNDGVTMDSPNDLNFNTVGIDESILLGSYMTFKISEDKFGIPVTIKITDLYANIICEYDAFNGGFNNLLLETTGNYDISSNIGSISQLVNNTTIDISNLKYDVATIPIYSIGLFGVYFKLTLVGSVDGSLSLHFSTSIESGLQYTKENGFRIIFDFNKTNISTQLKGTLDLSAQARLELDAVNLDVIYAYVSIGYWGKGSLDIRKFEPMSCIDLDFYPYIHFGVHFNSNCLGYFGKKSPCEDYYTETIISDLGEDLNNKVVKNVADTISFNLHIEIKKDDKNNYTSEMVKECTYTNKIEGIYQGIKWQLDKITGKLRLTSTDEIPEKETDWKDYSEYIKTVSMDNTITFIPSSAFYNCDALSKVVIPNSVTSIGNWAFYNCSSLESIIIPDRVTSIGEYAFCKCTSLESIIIPNSVISIGSNAFDSSGLVNIIVDCPIINGFVNCDNLTSVILTENVTSIGNSAFYNCDALSKVVIPNSVTSIGEYAFYKCTSLESIIIPDSVTSIGEYAFANCTLLESISMLGNVIFIDRYAFAYCAKLESITILGSVTSIGEWVFYECTLLKSITILGNVTSIGGSAFSNCTSLESIAIPDGVICIGTFAFYACTSLENITIPDSITSIGDSAFCNCSSLKSITIPDSVTLIGEYAFSNCTLLEKIYCTKGSYADIWLQDNGYTDKIVYI